MAYVNPSTQTIKTCFQSHYSLPYFQREYKWESRHFVELLNDIQNAFMLNYDVSHGRKEVASYPPYFLGSIITSSAENGKKPLIDGQQRLTSVFLILARIIHQGWRAWRNPLIGHRIRLRHLNPADFGAHARQT